MTDRAPAAAMRSGTVGLLGWTNVGKSTLMNRLVGDPLAAVADVAQTTRRQIRGVCNVPGRGQIVFLDLPGMHTPRHRMNRAMVQSIGQAVHGVDLALLLVDASKGLGPGDRQVAEMLRKIDVVRLMVLNKVDLVRPKERLLPLMQDAASTWGVDEVIPVSALSGDGCDALVDRLLHHLPESDPLYPEDYLTDLSERDLVAERVREKLLHRTRQELPHAIAVIVDRWQDREDGLAEIHATILVERESQKPIVIGRGGELLKQVGIEARTELETLLGRRIFLELRVMSQPSWRDDPQVLRRLGLE